MLLMLLTRHMLPTLPMPQVATEPTAAQVDIAVEFDASIQTLGALESAAYRLIGTSTCQIVRNGGRFVCHLTPKMSSGQREPPSVDALRERFLDLVTDENIRLRIAEKTEGIRNVILALAFGALASSQEDLP
jgi:His-Xaa-Ser system protein HxsD